MGGVGAVVAAAGEPVAAVEQAVPVERAAPVRPGALERAELGAQVPPMVWARVPVP